MMKFRASQISFWQTCLRQLLIVAGFAGCLSIVFGPNQVHAAQVLETKLDADTSVAKAIDRATKFLIEQQATDGAWHSQSYGAMKQGAANTALVLYALSQLPEAEQPAFADVFQKAAKFLQPGIDLKDCVANPDGSQDYPVYSTAMILSVHKKVDLGLTETQIKKLVEFLTASQCNEERGFQEDNPNFGGWDILGPGSTNGKTAGANVSVTFYVLEALTQYEDISGVESSIALAKSWCDQMVKRSSDGGFYFTSQLNSTLNKAGWHDAQFRSPRSYGSATCDGLQIILQINAKATNADSRSKPIDWLISHPDIESVPGFLDEGSLAGWPASLRFYYLNSLSRVLDRFEKDFATETKKLIAAQLMAAQRKDGSWQNEFSRMREDDPLIATPFGLMALIHCSK